MRKNRVLTVLLIAALLAAMIPGTAFAKAKKSKKYVLTAGTKYTYEGGKWKKTSETFTASFDSSGKVKSVKIKNYRVDFDSTSYGLGSKEWKYAWTGNNLKKKECVTDWINYEEHDDPEMNQGAEKIPEVISDITSYTIKKGRPKKSTQIIKDFQGSSKSLRWHDETRCSYIWKGKKGTVKGTDRRIKDWGGSGFTKAINDEITLKSGRRVSVKEGDWKYTYYGDCLLKTESGTYADGMKFTRTYNKNGFIKEVKNDYKKTSYQWTIKKGVPKEVVVTEKSDSSTRKYKWVFTKTKSVSKIRNCDAYGLPVWLGVDLEYIGWG